MKQVAKKNDWVRIMQIILTPEERLKSLPESTRKVLGFLSAYSMA